MDKMNIGGKEYRVEVNWNAVTAFLEATNSDSMEALANIGQLKPSDVTALIAACINEGERLEGHDTHVSALDLGAQLQISDISLFFDIYRRQSSPATAEDPSKKKE